MALEPSYYPLSPLKAPQGAISPSFEPLKGDSDLPERPDAKAAQNPPLSNGFRAPLRPRFLKNSLSSERLTTWRRVQTPLEMAILPLVAIAYLAFCYSVHGRAVPVDTYGLYSVTPEHFANIKGGITSISIIIISIALYPIYNIISDLKSEEFFRVLASRTQGVPLETVNHISNPSFGGSDMLMTMWNHTCSNYYILGIVASLLIWIVGTLAPGALTINTVLSDGELTAFAVGAIPIQSVLNATYIIQPSFNSALNADLAASIAWAEMDLGVQYSFGVAKTSEPDHAAYIVPIPIDLSTSTSARWLTDVIGLNPTCSWASTNLTTIQLPFNSTSGVDSYYGTAHLLDFDLDVPFTSSTTSLMGNNPFFATILSPVYYVLNHTTQAPVSDGSTLFLLGECTSGCIPSSPVDLTLDLSGVNTTFTVAFTDETYSLAILACVPNITIETREVRNDGHGTITVQPRPSGNPLTRQGNLNPIQSTALFSIATMGISQSSAGSLSGANSEYNPFGSQIMGEFLIGKATFDSLPGSNVDGYSSMTVTPVSIDDLTSGYIQLVKSVTKAYLGGYLGTAYVPGRISTTEIVFAASIPNLAVATAVFALLAAVIVVAHFRPEKGTEFTLVNVAAAVHGSELPALFARGESGSEVEHADVDLEGDAAEMEGAWGKRKKTRDSAEGSAHRLEGNVEGPLGERRIYMQRRADGSPVLHIDG